MTGWSAAFSPCQITGFFKIHDQFADPRRVGSTGVGVCLEQGVTTKVRLERGRKSRVLLNGGTLALPVVSKLVLAKFQNWPGSFSATVEHSTQLPVGCGYGTSGAGALSLALALNDALDEPVSRVEAAQIAHSAEVEAHTGLGTVGAEFTGGPVVRLKPGAPGVGVTKRLRFGKNARVVSASFGPFRKSRVLGNQRLSDRVNECGNNLVTKFMKHPGEETFIQLSRRFTHCLSLGSPRLERAMKQAEAYGVFPSMMMLGESLFCIVQKDDVGRARKALSSVGMDPITSRVAYRGARLL